MHGCTLEHLFEYFIYMIPIQSFYRGVMSLISNAHFNYFKSEDEMHKQKLQIFKKYNQTEAYNISKSIHECPPVFDKVHQCINMLLISAIVYFMIVLVIERIKLEIYRTSENSTVKYNI